MTVSLKPKNLSFVTPKKRKVLFLSDMPLAHSGVGSQARFLIEGLVKTGKWSFRCLGGAIKHSSYETIIVNPDFVIKPVDGFGDHASIRQIVMTERPDALVIFTDPRQFVWLWQIEDEVRQVCPLVYWHVWDNDPYPEFNNIWYESTDMINCLAKKTYDLVAPRHPDKTNYIPHSFPPGIHFPLPKEQVRAQKQQHFGPTADHFIALWVNRNAHRKMPNDVLNAWKLFIDNLQAQEGHKRAMLVMHTNPTDIEGPNLAATSEMLGLQQNVTFSVGDLDFPQMNILYNMADTVVNISKAEGFGLSPCVAMTCGKPIIVSYTGGHIHQIIDPSDGFVHGVAVKPAARTLVGSQQVPYIYDDHVSHVDVADAFMKVYKMTTEEREEIGKRAMSYVEREFSYDKMISEWDRTLTECVDGFKDKPKWSLDCLNPLPENLVAVSPRTLKERTKL